MSRIIQRHGRLRRGRLLAAGLGVVGLIAAGSGLAYAVSGAGRPSPGGNVCPTPAPAPALCFPGAHLSPQKAAFIRRMENQIAAARRHPPTHLPQPSSASSILPPRVEGLIHSGQNPLGMAEFAAVDAWQGPVGQRWVVAYAGSLTHMFAAAPTGAIALYVEPVNPNAPGQYFTRVGIFSAPQGDVRLEIISYRGDVLTLKAKSGAIIHFDVATHSYS